MKNLIDRIKNAWREALQWERDNKDEDSYDKWQDYR